MAEPIHYLDAAAARDVISEELQEVAEKIRDLNAQTLKMRAAFKAACRSGEVSSDAKVAAMALLQRAEKAAHRWCIRLVELRQKLTAASRNSGA